MEFYEAWHWLEGHPINLRPFDGSLEHDQPLPPANVGLYEIDIHVVKVNSITLSIEDDETLNDTVRIWLELGPYSNYAAGFEDIADPFYQRTHDPNLDCGGATFEEAIINLARLVMKHYGDYR